MPTVRLTWTDLNSGLTQEDEFRVYRSLTAFDESSLPPVLATLPPDSVSYDDASAVTNTRYYYAVAAVKGSAFAISFTGEVLVEFPAAAAAVERFLLVNSGSQVIPGASTTEIILGTEIFDTFNVAASNRFTVSSALNGYYALLSASLTLATAVNQRSDLNIQRSTDGGMTWQTIANYALQNALSHNISTHVRLTTGEIYRAACQTPDPASLTAASSELVNFGAIILGPIP